MQEKIQNVGVLKQKEELEKRLASEISRKFGVSEALVKKLIFETHLNLENLKKELKKEKISEKIVSKKDLEKLLDDLKKSKRLIENLSKKQRQELLKFIENLEKNNLFETNKILKQFFPEKMIQKAKNPQNLGEEIMGASLGILNSTIIIGELILDFGVGILKSPKDLYDLILGKAYLENLKKI